MPAQGASVPLEWIDALDPMPLYGSDDPWEQFARGAIVAFSLMGMAEAIRRTHLGYREIRVRREPARPISLEPDCEPILDWIGRLSTGAGEVGTGGKRGT